MRRTYPDEDAERDVDECAEALAEERQQLHGRHLLRLLAVVGRVALDVLSQLGALLHHQLLLLQEQNHLAAQ